MTNSDSPRNQEQIARPSSDPRLITSLVLSPPVSASHALVEARHGLVGTADLDLEESGLVAVTALVGALDAALLRIVPGSRPAEHVLLLDALVHAAREDGLGDVVLEGAGAALEAVGARVCEGDGEDVGAMGADYQWLARLGGEVRMSLTEQHDGGLLGTRVDSKKLSAIEPWLKVDELFVVAPLIRLLNRNEYDFFFFSKKVPRPPRPPPLRL